MLSSGKASHKPSLELFGYLLKRDINFKLACDYRYLTYWGNTLRPCEDFVCVAPDLQSVGILSNRIALLASED
jgi:hypothetical protein